jgi:Domain of unknown function (DUF5076)
MPKQLPIPQAAVKDRNSVEIFRVWAVENTEHVSVNAGLWKDPAMYGLVLADLAKHIANAYKHKMNRDPQKTLERIMAGFAAEMDSPTDTPKGQVIR